MSGNQVDYWHGMGRKHCQSLCIHSQTSMPILSAVLQEAHTILSRFHMIISYAVSRMQHTTGDCLCQTFGLQPNFISAPLKIIITVYSIIIIHYYSSFIIFPIPVKEIQYYIYVFLSKLCALISY